MGKPFTVVPVRVPISVTVSRDTWKITKIEYAEDVETARRYGEFWHTAAAILRGEYREDAEEACAEGTPAEY